MCDSFILHEAKGERAGEVDLDQISGGAKATEAAPPGGLIESAVIALMLEAAPVGELRMLLTGGISTSVSPASMTTSLLS